jgi:hypothetical protein
MRRALVCFTILIGSLLAAAGPAAAQAPSPLPACGQKDWLGEALDADYWDNGDYAFAGELFTMDFQTTAEDAPKVTGLVLSYVGPDGATVSSPPQPAAGEHTKMGVAVPGTAQLGKLTAQWDQAVGTQLACHATQTLPFWVLKPGTTAGNPHHPTLSGTFKVTYTPRNFHGRATRYTERYKPKCDIFACDVASWQSGRPAGTMYFEEDDKGAAVWGQVSAWHPATGWSCGKYRGVASMRTVWLFHVTDAKAGPDGAPLATVLTGEARDEFRRNARGRAHCRTLPTRVMAISGRRVE